MGEDEAVWPGWILVDAHRGVKTTRVNEGPVKVSESHATGKKKGAIFLFHMFTYRPQVP